MVWVYWCSSHFFLILSIWTVELCFWFYCSKISNLIPPTLPIVLLLWLLRCPSHTSKVWSTSRVLSTFKRIILWEQSCKIMCSLRDLLTELRDPGCSGKMHGLCISKLLPWSLGMLFSLFLLIINYMYIYISLRVYIEYSLWIRVLCSEWRGLVRCSYLTDVCKSRESL